MERYLGLSRWDGVRAEDLPRDIDGVILGDLFCERAMFPGGAMESLFFAQSCADLGEKVIYQTGYYLPDSDLQEEILTMDAYYKDAGTRTFLVQDVGLVIIARKRYPDAKLVWSHMGRNRGQQVTKEFVTFLKELGIGGMETDRIERMRAFREAGMPVYAVDGNLVYQTMGRLCYTRYETDDHSIPCSRACMGEKRFLVNRQNGIQMEVDGYLLGAKLCEPGDREAFDEAAEQYAGALMQYRRDLEAIR